MSDTILYVPVVDVNSRESSLYTVTSTPSSDSWYVNGSPYGKVEVCEPWFLQYLKPQELGAQLTVKNPGKGLLTDLVGGKDSVSLGLLLGFIRHLLHWQIRNDWESVTITGNIEPHGNTINFLGVDDISTKYKSAASYAKDHSNGNHLFLYVSDTVKENELTDIEEVPNLKVKNFTQADSLGEVLGFLFEPHLNDEQNRLFSFAGERTIAYVPSPDFKQMQIEVRSKGWKGYFIYGESETGKSRLALELAHYLVNHKYYYAPIWVTIDNNALRTGLDAYITREIANRLQLNLNDCSSEQNIKSLCDALGKYHYLLVIENLNLDQVNLVLESVDSIIINCIPKPAVMLTSRFGENMPGCAMSVGLKPIQPPTLTSTEIEDLIDNEAYGKPYKAKLDRAKVRGTDYREFTQIIYDKFRHYPGIIMRVIDMLEYMSVSSIITMILTKSSDRALDDRVAKWKLWLENWIQHIQLNRRLIEIPIIRYYHIQLTLYGSKEDCINHNCKALYYGSLLVDSPLRPVEFKDLYSTGSGIPSFQYNREVIITNKKQVERKGGFAEVMVKTDEDDDFLYWNGEIIFKTKITEEIGGVGLHIPEFAEHVTFIVDMTNLELIPKIDPGARLVIRDRNGENQRRKDLVQVNKYTEERIWTIYAHNVPPNSNIEFSWGD
ncbi:hypothetical protein FACS1894200_00020 [Spirochaetia bacterium]|nr:hypothetical protein FACS1894200_00020 [Spirochaetia bacterium]